MDKYNIIKCSDVDSTNNYALSLKENVLFKEGLVISSDFQIKGRGQRGNNWESERGSNLIMSVVIEPNISIKKQFDLSKISSLSVMECMSNLGVDSSIKWPNDILVHKHKIAGILIENLVSNNIITHSVIGIGLNVNQLDFDDYKPIATSLRIELNKHLILKEIQTKILNSLSDKLRIYRGGRSLESEYLDALFQKDKVAFFETNFARFNGIIRGVTAEGLLIIETKDAIKNFSLKEIKMIF